MRLTSLFVMLCILWVGCRRPAPLNPRAALLQAEGTRFLKKGELDYAQARFELALSYNPRYLEGLNGLGLVLLRRGFEDKALGYFQKALRINEDFSEGHHNKGVVLLSKGDFSGAKESFLAALDIDPGYAAARYGLARVYVAQKNLRKASGEYSKLVALATKEVRYLTELGCLQIRQRKFAKAGRYLRRSLRLDPSYGQTYHCLGYLFYLNGNYGEAQGALSFAHKKLPEDDSILARYIAALIADGRLLTAKGLNKGLLVRKPHWAISHLLSAMLAEKEGKYRLAKQFFTKSEKLEAAGKNMPPIPPI